jgi:hypothetical protein
VLGKGEAELHRCVLCTTLGPVAGWHLVRLIARHTRRRRPAGNIEAEFDQALGKATPQQVCRMVQDWFAAQIAIKDPASQLRLLLESLRPVVAGSGWAATG